MNLKKPEKPIPAEALDDPSPIAPKTSQPLPSDLGERAQSLLEWAYKKGWELGGPEEAERWMMAMYNEINPPEERAEEPASAPD